MVITTDCVEPVKTQCAADCALESGLQGEEQKLQKTLKYRGIRVVKKEKKKDETLIVI